MKILVALDLSESTKEIVIKAKEMARAHTTKLWLLHVAEPEPDFIGFDIEPQTGRDALSKAYHSEHCQLQDIAEELRKEDFDATSLLVQGATVETILKEAENLDTDMIIIGSHGRGAMYQVLVGSVSEGVIQKSKSPVLVVPTHKRS